MTIGDIYKLVVDLGIKNGPRSKSEIKEQLDAVAEEYKKMDEGKKKYFDKERLTNPFGDTRVLHGALNLKVKCMMVGVDMETPELLLANEVNKTRTKKIDMVLAHHPEGHALKALGAVMDLHQDIMGQYGVPENIMEKLMEPHISLINRSLSPGNYQRPVDAARLLDMPYACFHTASDNMVWNFIKKLIDKKKPKVLGDILKVLLEVPEYQGASRVGDMPYIAVGNKKSKVGKIAISGMTGGTEGPETVYEHLSRAGVGTLIDMHISEKNRKKAEKYHLNVVVASHIASDSVGMNLLLDPIERKGVEIVPVSGFIRVKR